VENGSPKKESIGIFYPSPSKRKRITLNSRGLAEGLEFDLGEKTEEGRGQEEENELKSLEEPVGTSEDHAQDENDQPTLQMEK